MTKKSTTKATSALENVSRRKRLTFRAWHRGLRELDILLGRYSDSRIASMTEAELAEFEQILSYDDPQLLGWLTGQLLIPAECDSPLLRELVASSGK